MRNLRNLGGRRFVRDQFAGLVVGCRNPVLARDDAKVIVLVVANYDLACGGNVLADHDRGAGRGVHGDRAESHRESGSQQKIGLFHDLFLLMNSNELPRVSGNG